MSWCGGGLIRPTPGVEWRTRAMLASTLWPGSCPPSPGLAPWAILIWMSSALTRYSLVTPKRPEATCLTADRRTAPVAAGEGVDPRGVSHSLAGVGPPAEPVQRDRAGFVRLARDRPVGHRAGREP